MNSIDGMSMHGDVAMTVEHFQPCWLGVYRFDDLKTGKSWRAVQRSVLVRDDSSIYKTALELIGGAAKLHSQTDDDEAMMFGQAEWALYEVSR